MGRIVVGIDGSEGSRTALRWAFDEALRRSSTVCLLHAWSFPFSIAPMAVPIAVPSFEEMNEVASAILDQALADIAAPAGLQLERRTVEGGAAEALIDAAKDAELLVVGTRGLGGFSRLLLGSVSHQCVHHAPCPVVVVPPEQ